MSKQYRASKYSVVVCGGGGREGGGEAQAKACRFFLCVCHKAILLEIYILFMHSIWLCVCV